MAILQCASTTWKKTRINSTEFQRALLSLWLGESQVDGRLKRAMPGREQVGGGTFQPTGSQTELPS
ncbi:MAG: chalcone isomerase family protein [Thiohalophilus sp.]